MAKVLWEPTAETIEKANITHYSGWLEGEVGVVPASYRDLWRWSVEEVEDFWASMWRYFQVRSSTPYSSSLEKRVMPGARWFPGSSINYAEHIFARKRPGKPAVLSKTEQSGLEVMTWDELESKVGALAESLRTLGVKSGDRVASYLPNVPETVVSLLACASVGAIWSSCAPDFGARSAVDRFKQIGPKVFISSYGYYYKGRWNSKVEAVSQVREAVPSIERVIMAGEAKGASVGGALEWDDLAREEISAFVRASALRPSALDRVFVGDDRFAQADSTRARGYPHGAPEDALLPQRPGPGGQDVLVHIHGVDDVELLGQLPPPRVHDNPVRGRPLLP